MYIIDNYTGQGFESLPSVYSPSGQSLLSVNIHSEQAAYHTREDGGGWHLKWGGSGIEESAFGEKIEDN